MTYHTLHPLRCEGLCKRWIPSVEMPPGTYLDADPIRVIHRNRLGDEIRILRPAEQRAGEYDGVYYMPQVTRLIEALAPAGDSSSPVLSPAGRGN